jgi:hypothetical protein
LRGIRYILLECIDAYQGDAACGVDSKTTTEKWWQENERRGISVEGKKDKMMDGFGKE